MAELEAQKDKSFVSTTHVLIGMILEGDNGTSLMLRNAGFTAEGLRNNESPNRIS